MSLLSMVAAVVIAATTACSSAERAVGVLAPDPLGVAVTLLKVPTDPVQVATGGPAPALAPDLAELANRVAPSLVDVTTYRATDPVKVGTGIVLNSAGLVLTNQHVIAGGTAVRITTFGDGQAYPAVLLGADVARDLALLQIQAPVELPPAAVGDSDLVRVGDRVASIGNGYGYGLGIGAGPVTRVNVTTAPSGEGSSQLMTGMIEAHTDLRPGASGGAMVNTAGEVIGVDSGTGIAPGTTTVPNGYGYAIPINAALDVANELLAGN
jgi:S1-C subfamily serine protease